MDAGLFRNDKKKHPDELEPMIISPILTERGRVENWRVDFGVR